MGPFWLVPLGAATVGAVGVAILMLRVVREGRSLARSIRYLGDLTPSLRRLEEDRDALAARVDELRRR